MSPRGALSALRHALRALTPASALAALIAGLVLPIVAPTIPIAQAASGDGLRAFYVNDSGSASKATNWSNRDVVINPAVEGTCATGTITTLNQDWGTGSPSGCPADNFSGYFTGYILGPKTGTVNFSATADDSFMLRIADTQVLGNFGTAATVTGSFNFTAGQVYPVQIFFYENTGGALFNLRWDASGSSTTITSSNLGTTPSVLLDSVQQDSNCQVGSSALCPAFSAQEIYNLYGTTTDGNYWILVGGSPTYQYVLMNRSLDNGGWVLAMKGTSTTTNFRFDDTQNWTTAATLNKYSGSSLTTPSRLGTSNTDGKFDSFNGIKAQRIRAIFPSYAASTYGGRYTTNNNYGFMWDESLSSLSSSPANSTYYAVTAGNNGYSSACSYSSSTLLSLFSGASRCLFRQPAASYTAGNSNTANYDPIGNGVFSSQNVFRWWGINYRQPVQGGSPNAFHNARWGFGWNENESWNEGSNDVTGGIGLDATAANSKSSGDHIGCCQTASGQNTQMGFEIYVRKADPNLGTPQNLTASYTAAQTITLNWNALSGAHEYVLQYKLKTDSWTTSSPTRRVYVPTGTSPSIAISGLTGTDYDFRVYARSLNTTSDYDTNSSATAATVSTTLGTALTPTFGTPTYSAGSFTIPVTNYDANFNWTYTASNGTALAGTPSGSTVNVTVTPSAAGQTATLRVDTTRTNFFSGTATSSAYYGGCNPTSATSGGYTTLTFTAVITCGWTVPTNVKKADVLVVGGGGGGGVWVAGGGGGGAVTESLNLDVSVVGSTTITVGAGGTGSSLAAATNVPSAGTNGGSSSALGITAAGGGVGGSWTTAPTSGASGGGGTGNQAGASGTAGFAGGSGSSDGNHGYPAGGGGGAGGKGGDAVITTNVRGTAGSGGAGKTSSITGSTYGGGGGAGCHGNGTYPCVLGTGASGGGDGGGYLGSASGSYINPTSGANNTGSGGGGAGTPAGGSYPTAPRVGGSGGSGVVVIRYGLPTNYTYALNGGTGTTPSGGTAQVGSTITLPTSAGFSRANFTLSGWNDGSATYSVGATYTVTSSTSTLTAQWTATNYTITYSANTGGSNPPATQTFAPAGSPTSATVAAKTGMVAPSGTPTFVGWNTAADGSGTWYQPGDVYSTAANLSLYAIWSCGTVTTSGNYTVVSFTSVSTCNWVVPKGVQTIDVLVVGGGGGGGSRHSGGGGAGGVIYTTNYSVTQYTSIPVSVGDGGAGAPGSGAGGGGANGSNSSFGGASGIVANGGGVGGSNATAAGNGGSGGGSNYQTSAVGTSAPGTTGGVARSGTSIAWSVNGGTAIVNAHGSSGAVGQGNGCKTADNLGGWCGGGGGGASAAGSSPAVSSGTRYRAGNGGDGIAIAITGTSVTYGGGGGGGAGGEATYANSSTCNSTAPLGGLGGAGGGGNGATCDGTGANGGANTGGGGGGGSLNYTTGATYQSGPGGNGGSGVVILRYVSTALTPTFSTPVATSNGFTVNVTNYDPTFSFTPTVSSGLVSKGTASGTTLPLTVTGLSAGASATVTVSTSANGLTGSGTVSSAAYAALSTPTNLAASATAGVLKSIGLTWTAATNATSYTIRIYSSAGSLLQTIYNVTGTSKTITTSEYSSLVDNTSYQFSITAVGTGYNDSTESAKVSATTLQPYTVTYSAATATSGTASVASDVYVPGGTGLILATQGTMKKSGYYFAGWSTTSGGAANVSGPYAPTSSITLYAAWTSCGSAVVQTGLIGHYDAGNSCSTATAGKWTDISTNGNDITLINGPVYSSGRGGQYTFSNGDLLTSGTSGKYGTFPTNNSGFTNGFSISFFASFSATARNNERIIDWGNGGGSNNIVIGRGGTSNALVLYTTDAGTTCSSSSNFIDNGVWNFYAFTLDTTNGCKFYKNGVLDQTDGTIKILPASVSRAKNYLAFSNWTGDKYFDGSYGDIAIYNTTLSASDVMTNYLAQADATYTVTYDLGGGTGTTPTQANVVQGQKFIVASSSGLSRTGYTFNGWKDGGGTTYAAGSTYTVSTSNVALTAQWSAATYTITYKAGTNGTSSDLTQTFTYPNSATLKDASAALIRTGYSITGWATTDGGAQAYALGATYSATSNLTLYPVWGANTYTVTYKSGTAGTGSDLLQSFTYPNSITLKDATAPLTRTGYSITGWSTTDGGAQTNALNSSYSAAANLTLYPVWGGNTYTITYKAGTNGSGVDLTQTFTYPTAATLKDSTAALTRNGYSISGWSTSDGGAQTNSLSSSYSTAANLTLYPVWAKITCSVTADTTSNPGYTIYKFTNTAGCFWSNDTGATQFDVLVVGGGGGGGGAYDTGGAGGGGAGQVTQSTLTLSAGDSIEVAVGVGGTGGTGGNRTTVVESRGAAGGLSKFGTVVALGGDGGSRSRGDYLWDLDNSVVQRTVGTGGSAAGAATAAKGGAQGGNGSSTTLGKGGGGGGSSGASANATSGAQSLGGAGTVVNITGTSVTYGTGGAGSASTASNGTSALANTGNGGGGARAGSNDNKTGGSGGSGVVILRYANTQTITYNSNLGTGSIASTSASTGSSVTLSNGSGFTRSSYTLSKWNTSSAGTGTDYALGASITMPAGGLTLYAVWSLNTYTVTYSAATADSGSASIASAVFNVGGAGLTLATVGTMVKTGYTFAGWSTTNGGSANVSSPYSPTGDVTLYAAWTVRTYNVTFDSRSGSSVAGSTFAYGSTVAAPTSPTRTGYNFLGWFIATSGGTALTFPYAPGVANDITLYAQWSAISYTVTYRLNGGSGTTPTETSKNITNTFSVADIGSVTKTGYTFAGWNDGTNTYQPGATYTVGSDNVILTAQWNLAVYTITYNTNGATGSPSRSSESYTYGSAAINLPTVGTMAKTGYSFVGWSVSGSAPALSGTYTPTQTITLKAVWSANTYTVKYNINGGIGTTPSDSSYTTAGTAVTLPSTSGFSRTGYDFSGWSDGSTTKSGGATFTTSTNITLNAVWTIKSINFTYDKGSATSDPGLPGNGSANYASSITLGAPTSTVVTIGGGSYAFAGWNDGTNTYQSGSSYRLGASDVALTAQWVALYKVQFFGNGGTLVGSEFASECDATSKLCVSGTAVAQPASNPTRSGYTFAGWKDQSGATLFGSTWNISSTSYLAYAQWTPVSYTVTYNSGSGSTPPTESSKNIGDLFTVGSAVTRTGYTFNGWKTGGVVYAPGASFQVGTSNIQFDADWIAIDYNVSYDLNGGTSAVPSSVTKNYGNTVTTPAAPTRAGYNFTGWSDGTGTTDANSGYGMPAKDVTFTAQWSAIDYTLTYNSNGGSSAPAGQSALHIGDTFTVGSAVTLPDRNFLGWSDGTDSYMPGQTYTVKSANVALTAVWSGLLYTVTYNNGGGTGTLPTEDDHLAGDTVTVKSGSGLSRTGYTFAGWSAGGTTYQENNTFSMGSGPVTLTAVWTKKTLTFTFKANGGTGTDVTQSATADTSTSLRSNSFSRTDYTFAGWSANQDGSGSAYTNGQNVTLLQDTTFWAKWTPAFVVTFNSNGGSTVNSMTYTGTPLAKPADPTRDGYTFNGWSAAGSAVSWSYTPSASVTLTAQWVLAQYVLTYNAGTNGTSPRATDNYTHGSPALTLPTPTRANFVFEGWYDSVSGGSKIGMGGDAYTPAATRTLYARWTQTSLYGVSQTSLTSLGNITILNLGDLTLSLPYSGGTISFTVPRDSLPTNTVISPKLVGDLSRARDLISNADYILSMVISWLAADETVPDTASGKPISMTITNSSIKAGQTIYSILGQTVTVLGRATQDGTATFTLASDPEVVIAATKPDAPTAVTATNGANASSVVSWTAPAYNGGSAITGYTVTSSGGQTCTTSGATSCTVSGLTNGTPYTFTVTAINSIGTSDASAASSAITPIAPLAAPTSIAISATSGSATSLTVTFTANTNASSTKYYVYTAATGGTAIANGTITSGGAITGLTTGTTYYISLQSIGTGSYTTGSESARTSGTPSSTVPTISLSTGATGSYGVAQSITATVSQAGTVAFKLGATVISGCAAVAVASGTATCSWAPSAVNASASITATLTPTDTNYATSDASPVSVNVGKASQSITFAALTDKTLGSGDVTLSATASSSLTVTFTSMTTSTCTVSGTTITLVSAGTCTIAADQAGDSNYQAAPQLQRSFTINAAPSSGGGGTGGGGTGGGGGGGAVVTPVDPVTPPVVVPPVVVVPDAPIKQTSTGDPVIAAGKTVTVIDGKVAQDSIKIVETTQLVTQSGGLQLQLQSFAADQKPVAVDQNTKLVLQQEGKAAIAGAGFKSETSVKIWIFSDPTFLGEFKVDANGKFDASLLVLPTLPVGEHTLQINGVTPGNSIFSQSLPVIITEKPKVDPQPKPVDPTPKTGLIFTKRFSVPVTAKSFTPELAKAIAELKKLVKRRDVIRTYSYFPGKFSGAKYRQSDNYAIAIGRQFKSIKGLVIKRKIDTLRKARLPEQPSSLTWVVITVSRAGLTNF